MNNSGTFLIGARRKCPWGTKMNYSKYDKNYYFILYKRIKLKRMNKFHD